MGLCQNQGRAICKEGTQGYIPFFSGSPSSNIAPNLDHMCRIGFLIE